jgi:hypothetical protein
MAVNTQKPSPGSNSKLKSKRAITYMGASSEESSSTSSGGSSRSLKFCCGEVWVKWIVGAAGFAI